MQKLTKPQLRKWREDYTVWDAPCLGDGLALHVHFDEKDDVKRMGGRWHPHPSGKGGHWWMPINKLGQTCPFEDEEFWGPGGSGTMTFRVYPELDVVDIGNDVFQTVADSRTIWDDFMKIGWRKVISTTSEVNA